MTRKTHPIADAERKFRELGIIHAPVQGFLEGPGIDGRFVTLQEPPAVYYLLGIDNNAPPETEENIQLIFMGVPNNAQEIADAIGWKIKENRVMTIVKERGAGALPIYDGLEEIESVILEKGNV